VEARGAGFHEVAVQDIGGVDPCQAATGTRVGYSQISHRVGLSGCPQGHVSVASATNIRRISRQRWWKCALAKATMLKKRIGRSSNRFKLPLSHSVISPPVEMDQ